jgi:hypothetical protein
MVLRHHAQTNSGAKYFSDPHEVFCIGSVRHKAAGEKIFLNIATVWSILNLGRGHVSGWPNCLCCDCTGKVSKYQVTMVSYHLDSSKVQYAELLHRTC